MTAGVECGHGRNHLRVVDDGNALRRTALDQQACSRVCNPREPDPAQDDARHLPGHLRIRRVIAGSCLLTVTRNVIGVIVGDAGVTAMVAGYVAPLGSAASCALSIWYVSDWPVVPEACVNPSHATLALALQPTAGPAASVIGTLAIRLAGTVSAVTVSRVSAGRTRPGPTVSATGTRTSVAGYAPCNRTVAVYEPARSPVALAESWIRP